MRKNFIRWYILFFAFTAACLFTSCTQNPENSEEILKLDLSDFTIWNEEQSGSFNSATGDLILNEGWTNGGEGNLWVGGKYKGDYNYLEIKYKKSSSFFEVRIEYDDKTKTRSLCQKKSNVSYIKLESKKINNIVIKKKTSETFSTVLESFTLVKEKPVNNIEAIIDVKTGMFNSSISAIDLAKQMKVGWNLAGSLEYDSVIFDPDSQSETLDYIRSLGVECEGSPYTTKEIINFPKTQGYSTIRIPITWYNHIIDDNYTIDPKWMARVKEIVDWSIEAGYYVIINSHHDTMSYITSPIRKTNGYNVINNEHDIEESKLFLSAIWKQICTTFNGSYDEHLIFETLNEPRNVLHDHQWHPCVKNSWMDSTKCEECIADYKILNEYNQLCLDTIRASGGNNSNRFVMIPALCTGELPALNDYFKLPIDTASDKLILTVHNYILGCDPQFVEKTFTDQMQQELSTNYSQLNEKFVKKGIPIVVGETSANRLLVAKSERIKWITYFSKLTSSYGIVIIYWDGPEGGGYSLDQIDRVKLKIIEPDFVQAMFENWIPEESNNPSAKLNGKVDLSKLTEYDSTVQGLVKEFENPISNYDTIFTYKISDLGITEADGFTSIAVVGRVFNGEEEYDLNSDWLGRIFLKVGEEKQFNGGVSNMTIPFKSVDENLEIHIKEKPVTKIIITEITFSK